jgi:hypothetical protein
MIISGFGGSEVERHHFSHFSTAIHRYPNFGAATSYSKWGYQAEISPEYSLEAI